MSPEVISLIVLAILFVVATALPVNMGALAFLAAFLVGSLALGLSAEDIIANFPSDIFLLLVGITYLFGVAQSNGTVDLLVRGAVRLVRGRIAAIPWVMFAVTAVLVAIGALFAVAIVAPIALRFAFQHKIKPLLMGMMVVHGALGGAFSPISVYGGFINGLLADTALPSSPLTLFVAPLLFNLIIGVVVFLLLGGRSLLGQRPADASAAADADADGAEQAGGATVTAQGDGGRPSAGADPDGGGRVRPDQVATIFGIALFAVLTVAFQLDVGFTSISIGVVLALVSPRAQKGAVDQVAWSTVLLITGVLTYVGVLEAAGTIDYVSAGVIGLGLPLLSALLLCYIGGVASAFASSVAILGVAVPLAIPLLQQGRISAIGMTAALAVSTTVVDVSPFSTNGALVLANAHDIDRDRFYRQMLAYSAVVVVLGPLLAWAVLVLPAG